MKKVIAALVIYPLTAWSQEPTIIYGASKTAPNVSDEFEVVQPENSPNPLGNPIITATPAQLSDSTQATPQINENQQEPAPKASNFPKAINESATQDPAPFSISPQKQQQQIENTLYESGNRIYDIQSYPLKDIKTITEPNIDPTITTYPEY